MKEPVTRVVEQEILRRQKRGTTDAAIDFRNDAGAAPGRRFTTGKLKPGTEPEAITEALQKAGLFEEPEVPEQDQDSGG